MHVPTSCTRHHLHALEVIQAPRRYKYGIIGKQSVESISGMTSDFSTHVLRESTKEQRVAKRAQIAKKADGMPSTVEGQCTPRGTARRTAGRESENASGSEGHRLQASTINHLPTRLRAAARRSATPKVGSEGGKQF